jgi:hypothetical protein
MGLSSNRANSLYLSKLEAERPNEAPRRAGQNGTPVLRPQEILLSVSRLCLAASWITLRSIQATLLLV